MHFDNLSSFLNMGGYGLYVWLSFGLGFLSVAWLWGASIVTKKSLFKDVLAEQARQQRIKAANSGTNQVGAQA